MTARSAFGHVFQRPERKGYYIRLCIHGRRTERYAGPDRKTAYEVLARMLTLQRRKDLLGEKPVAAVPLAQVVEDFRDFLRAKHSPTTFAVEDQRLHEIAEVFGKSLLRDIDAGMVEDFLTEIQTVRNLSTATRNRHQSLLSVLFRFAIDRGMANRNPVEDLTRGKEEVRDVGFLSDADVSSLVAAAAGEPVFGVFVRVLADAGLRRGEALALTWRDVTLGDRPTLLVRRSKTGRPRVVPMTPAVATALRSLRDAAPSIPLAGDDPVFPSLRGMLPSSVSKRLEAVRKRAGLPPMSLHSLRHGFCSRLAQRGIPLPTIAQLAGHVSLHTTWRYARHLPTDAAAAAIATLGAGAAPLARAAEG